MKARLLIIVALSLLVFAAHWPALHAGFVWDDTALVLRDPLIRSWRLIPEGFQHFLFTDATPSNFYRPLQRLTYSAEYAAFVFNPSPYHFDNLLLHAAVSIALFLFALSLLELYAVDGRTAGCVALVASVAWAVHPIHSEVVDYVSGRADSLAALFGFTALCFGIHAIKREGRASWRFHALAAIALLLSALSKESGLVFALVYLALVALRMRARAIIPALVAIVFLATIYGTLRGQVAPVEVPRLTPPAPAIVRPIIAARALAEYAALLVAPIHLHVERDVESHPWGMSKASLDANAWRELETLAGVTLAGALLFWMWRVRKREPAVFALLLFAVISYAPVCGVFALNGTMAEHWIYVPSAFLFVAAALEIAHVVPRKRAGTIVLVLTCVWIAALGVRSFMRAGDWKAERTFFENTIAQGGDSARMLLNLGALEMNEGHLDSAETLLKKALAKQPDQPFALLDLAGVALKRNDFATARAFLDRARQHPVTEAQAYEAMAVLEYKQTGKVNLLRLRLASRSGTPSWPITQRYIRALDEIGQTGAAIAELRVVLATEWYRAETWRLLSAYLAKTGHPSQAAEVLAEAKQLDVHLNEH